MPPNEAESPSRERGGTFLFPTYGRCGRVGICWLFVHRFIIAARRGRRRARRFIAGGGGATSSQNMMSPGRHVPKPQLPPASSAAGALV